MKIIKKILVVIAVCVIIVGIFGFAACDKDDKGSDNKDNVHDVGGGADDEDDDVKTVLTEDTDFEALISEKVTKEEWVEAFADGPKYSNYTLKFIFYNGSVYYLKFQVVDDGLYILQSNNHSDGVEYVEYLHCIDGFLYGYAPGQTDGWIECGVEWNDAALLNWATTYRVHCPDFGEFYDRFTYNEELGQYEFLGSKDDCITTRRGGAYELHDYYDVKIKIVNGRLAYVATDDGVDFFYDFNNSSFDIPNV